MARSVSPLDFTLAIKFLNTIASNPGLTKLQISNILKVEEKSSKISSIITNFNENHLNLVRRERGNKYYLNAPNDIIPSENSLEQKCIAFWREQFLNFPLYIEVLQAFSFGNKIKKVSEFTGVSIVSTGIIADWAEMVGDLEKIDIQTYIISIRSIEELLNRIVVCQLGLLGCSIIEREKQLEESGMRIDVYGLDKRNNKEYFIESESSALNLNQGIMQAHTWISSKKGRIEKWVTIPIETLKEITFETLEKRYNTAINRRILIKLCHLNPSNWSKIINLEIPRARDKKLFVEIRKFLKDKKSIKIEDISKITQKPISFKNRMIRFGLLIEEKNAFYPSFKL